MNSLLCAWTDAVCPRKCQEDLTNLSVLHKLGKSWERGGRSRGEFQHILLCVGGSCQIRLTGAWIQSVESSDLEPRVKDLGSLRVC